MKRLYLPYPPDLSNPLKQFALGMIHALEDRYELSGDIDMTCGGDDEVYRYSSAPEALTLLEKCDESSLLSIRDQHFSILLDKTSNGIDISFVALDTDESIYAEIERLSNAIVLHLKPDEPQDAVDTPLIA